MKNYDLTDLEKWRAVPMDGLTFPREEPRKVRIEVLAEERTGLVVEHSHNTGSKKPVRHFIGNFDGYGVVSFAVPGAYRLLASAPGVSIWTPEVETIAVEIPDAVSFTTMMQRRERNPELELMMHKMSSNMERRIREVTRDLTVAARQEAKLEAKRIAEEERAARNEADNAAAARSTEAATRADAEDDPEPPAQDVSGGGGKAKGSKLAKQPAA